MPSRCPEILLFSTSICSHFQRWIPFPEECSDLLFRWIELFRMTDKMLFETCIAKEAFEKVFSVMVICVASMILTAAKSFMDEYPAFLKMIPFTRILSPLMV